MNNKEREIIATFLIMIKDRYDETSDIIYQFIQDIDDKKLNEIYNNYCDIENIKKYYMDLIERTSIKLFEKDFPNDYHSYLSKNFRSKPYYTLAKEKILQELLDEDTDDKIDEYNIIKTMV